MREGDEPVEVDYDVMKSETAAARLYQIADRQVWLPLSMIAEDDGEGTVTIPRWLAEDRGLV